MESTVEEKGCTSKGCKEEVEGRGVSSGPSLYNDHKIYTYKFVPLIGTKARQQHRHRRGQQRETIELEGLDDRGAVSSLPFGSDRSLPSSTF